MPVNKTSSAFTKPVDKYVGEAINEWEQERPFQPELLDKKTSKFENFLFMFRGKVIGSSYINGTIIPMLYNKAGIPISDIRGKLTSHRARSTIASQLFNAKEPMSLFELQTWLGHSSVSSTQYDAKISPTKLTKSYKNAGYFERNLRMVEVRIDQDAINNRSIGDKTPWKYYDLEHGYCSYDFFDQCPHRMVCVKCSFYVPKESSQMQIVEAKENLVKMLQKIPLTDSERAAVEDGIEAFDALEKKLKDVPPPKKP